MSLAKKFFTIFQHCFILQRFNTVTYCVNLTFFNPHLLLKLFFQKVMLIIKLININQFLFYYMFRHKIILNILFK